MIPSISDDFLTTIEDRAYPSFTYKMIYEKELFSGYVDGIEAVKQAIYKRLLTQKSAYPIYNQDYGIDLKSLYGMAGDWVKAVLPERIKESLYFDDRIQDIYDLNVEINKINKVVVSFHVKSVYGDFDITNLEVTDFV